MSIYISEAFVKHVNTEHAQHSCCHSTSDLIEVHYKSPLTSKNIFRKRAIFILHYTEFILCSFLWLVIYSSLHCDQHCTKIKSSTTAALCPSKLTDVCQALVTAGVTLISLNYLFHPSPEQIEQKHQRLFQHL